MPPAYEEVIEFLAAGTTPDRLIAFEPSSAAKSKVAELIGRQKVGTLSADESAELDHFLQLEHILRLAKARARKYVLTAQS